MDIHHIHGTEVGFHSGTEGAHSFLNHESNRHVAESYLNQAKATGEAHFYDDKGNKFRIEHKADENGKSVFSIEKSHHY